MQPSRKALAIILSWAMVTIAGISLLFFFGSKDNRMYKGRPGQVVQLTFELDKTMEFGQYFFDIDNARGATYQLCYCLTDHNEFPRDCKGDVSYIYNDTPAIACIPMHIGNGQCFVKPVDCMGHATPLYIPLEYRWVSRYETIVVGIRVPEKTPSGAVLAVGVNLYRTGSTGELRLYRSYSKFVKVNNEY